MRAIIIGGGIGGLAAGIAFRQAGLDVQVYDQVPEIRAVGAGIVLSANGMAALERLGCAAEITATGCLLQRYEMRSRRGAVLKSYSLRDYELELGQPTVAIHRADLHHILAMALGQDALHLGAKFERFEDSGEGVTAYFAGGFKAAGNLLIGADGVHSAVREQLIGDGQPRYAGYTAWRGIAEFDYSRLPPNGAFAGFGRGSEVGIVPIGKERVYWYATANAPEGAIDSSEGRKARLIRRFRHWFDPMPSVIDATPPERILSNDIYDRDPSKRWGRGRVTLLGDAAHPMTPNLGQGAGQALEDAVVLGRCFEGRTDLDAALRSYERRRMPRTAALVKASRMSGRILQLENPAACLIRDWLLRLMPTGLFLRQARTALVYSLD